MLSHAMLRFASLLILLNSITCEEVEAPAKTQSAFILASKSLENTYIVADKDCYVTYTIYNVGDGPAYNVILKDKSMDADSFRLVNGVIDAKWEKIDSNQTVSHSILAIPKLSGKYNFTHAEVSYLAFPNAPSHQTVSTSAPGIVKIMHLKEYEKIHSYHLMDWLTYIIMTLPSLLIPFLFWHKSKTKYEQILFKSHSKKKQ